jgi:hypothetical protein
MNETLQWAAIIALALGWMPTILKKIQIFLSKISFDQSKEG